MSAREPEFRWDVVRAHWTAVAPERLDRPAPSFDEAGLTTCPFCEGQERQTPAEVFADRAVGPPNTPGWRVRVVENRFPVVRDLGNQPRPISVLRPDFSLGKTFPGDGRHEVIIESASHESRFVKLGAEQLARVFLAYGQRIWKISHDTPDFYMLVFKNEGSAAGASQPHVHSQLVATRILPSSVRVEKNRRKHHLSSHRNTLLGDLLHWELQQGVRIVEQTENFVAWLPFSSRQPYETWIAPRDANHAFPRDFTPSMAGEFARLVQHLLLGLEHLLGEFAFNFALQLPPPGLSGDTVWRLEIIPRLFGIAGYELGCGMYINPVPPELAAAQLRAETIIGLPKQP